MKLKFHLLNLISDCSRTCTVRSDPGSTEQVHVSERDNIASEDVDADVEATKIALPHISAGSPSQQNS